MAEENGGFRQAFCSRGANVIAGKLFDHRRAHHAGENSGQRGAQSKRRKNQMRETAASGNWKPAEEYGEHENQHRTESEIRHRESKQSENADGMIR